MQPLRPTLQLKRTYRAEDESIGLHYERWELGRRKIPMDEKSFN